MMNKKTFLLQLFQKFEDDWEPSGLFKNLIEADMLDGDMINALVDAFHKEAVEHNNKIMQKKFKKGAEILTQIKNLEEHSMSQDQEALLALEELLEQL